MYSNLVYLRFVPLSEAELNEYQRELPQQDTKRLIAMNDAGIFSELRTKEDIWAQFEPYRDSDVGIMLWATFKGENCTYRSRIGRILTDTSNPFDRFAAHERWEVTLKALEEQGIDFHDRSGASRTRAWATHLPKPPSSRSESGTTGNGGREFL